MGYESRIYIVEKFDNSYDERYKKVYSIVVSMFNMCKFPRLASLFSDKPDASCYFYADDGNTVMLEDEYGCPLQEAGLEEVIETLERAIIVDKDSYWRIYPLLSALQAYKLSNMNVVVLHYGY